MKSFLLLITLVFSFSLHASNDCRLFFIMSQFDGSAHLTNQILEKSFSEKGYEIFRVERITKDLLQNGSANELIIFSDAHRSFGARTDISLTNISFDRTSGNLQINKLLQINLTKSNSIFNSATNRLIKAVSDAIPSCENLE